MHVSLLTKTDLSLAIEARLDVPTEIAERDAEYVLEIFGFEEQVIDNALEPEDRQLFYALQQKGLLTTRSEETAIWNGQEWRTHYWVLRHDRVVAAGALLRAMRTPRREAPAPEDDVYAALPADAWTRK